MICGGHPNESAPPRKKALCIESCSEIATQLHSHKLESVVMPHPLPSSLPHVEMPDIIHSDKSKPSIDWLCSKFPHFQTVYLSYHFNNNSVICFQVRFLR